MKECPKCSASMKKGMKVMHGNTWIEKEISGFDKKVTPMFTGFLNRTKSSNISSYSCSKCGYIEQYVDNK